MRENQGVWTDIYPDQKRNGMTFKKAIWVIAAVLSITLTSCATHKCNGHKAVKTEMGWL